MPDLTKLKHTFLGGNSCDAKSPESVGLHQSELWSNDGDEWLRFDSNHDAPSDSWQTWGLRRSRD
jgi:hypothetical protein